MLVIIIVTSLITVVILILVTAFYLVTILAEESDDHTDSFDVHDFITTQVSSPTSRHARHIENSNDHLFNQEAASSNQINWNRPVSNATASETEIAISNALKDDASSTELASSFRTENLDGSKSDIKSLDHSSTDAELNNKYLCEQEKIIKNQFGSKLGKQILDDFDHRDVKLGGNPLHWCKSRLSLDKLLTLDLPIDGLNSRHETPLHVAIRRKRLSVIISLLSRDPDVDIGNDNGETALIVACKTNYIVTCQLLLVQDADINKVDSRGKSARHYSSLICHRYKPTAKTPNAAHLILAMLHELGAERCPKIANESTKAIIANDCSEGCSPEGTYDGNSYNRWPDYTKESLYKRHMFMDLVNERRLLMRHPKASKKSHKSPDIDRSRLLCIDGGGMRGIVVCQVLIELQKLLKRPFIDYFDWIGGTSVGAFIGCALCVGLTLKQLKGICFELKDEVFTGRKPYNASLIENVLKRTLGVTSRMSDITGKQIAVATVIADRDPCQLRFFRNYLPPSDLLESNGFSMDYYNNMSGHSSVCTPTSTSAAGLPSDQQVIDESDRDPLIWQAVRASAAAPFFFKPYGPFLDGGIISNNPTLDMLSEFHNYHEVRKFLAKHGIGSHRAQPHLDIIVSLGTGRGKVRQAIFDINGLSSVFTPNWSIAELGRSIRALRDMFRKLIQQSCQTEDHILDRAQAWSSSLNIPYFRINPPLATVFPIDDKRDEQLVNALWQTKLYMRSLNDQLVELAEILDGPRQQCNYD